MNPYNYNQQYYQNPMNQPYMRSNMNVATCMTCGNTGYFRDMNGMNRPCTNCQGHNMMGQGGMINPMNQMGSMGQMGKIGNTFYHPGFLDSYRDKFRALSNCFTCRGSGFTSSKYGNQTICHNCIRANGYCPKCNNTGFKLKNGKRCNHRF